MIKLLGVSDDVTTCECCGRTGLKRTVAIDLNGAIVHYGCDCAARTFNSYRGSKYSAQNMLDSAKWAGWAGRVGPVRAEPMGYHKDSFVLVVRA